MVCDLPRWGSGREGGATGGGRLNEKPVRLDRGVDRRGAGGGGEGTGDTEVEVCQEAWQFQNPRQVVTLVRVCI